MTKEQLMAMGLNEEQAKKVLDSLDGEYVPKSKFQEVSEENKTLKKSVGDRDKQLENLKKSSGDNAELQKQISDLQKANAEQQKAHEQELSQLKLDNAIDLALSGAKAKNSKAVKAVMDLSKVKLGEDGQLTGFSEQLEALQKSDGYLFDAPQPTKHQFVGFQPGVSTVMPDAKSAGYESRLADARKNNNQLEIIKIKQEAAADGVVLM